MKSNLTGFPLRLKSSGSINGLAVASSLAPSSALVFTAIPTGACHSRYEAGDRDAIAYMLDNLTLGEVKQLHADSLCRQIYPTNASGHSAARIHTDAIAELEQLAKDHYFGCIFSPLGISVHKSLFDAYVFFFLPLGISVHKSLFDAYVSLGVLF